jgi:hypothetical protein
MVGGVCENANDEQCGYDHFETEEKGNQKERIGILMMAGATEAQKCQKPAQAKSRSKKHLLVKHKANRDAIETRTMRKRVGETCLGEESVRLRFWNSPNSRVVGGESSRLRAAAAV